MDPVTFLVTLWLVLVTLWLLFMATLWLVRILAEQLWWAVRGREGDSPRVQRRRERARLAREFGTPSVGQAITDRLAHRIENPPDRRWLAEIRALLAECTADAVAEARVRHHVNMRKRARRHAGWTAQTGGPSARTAPPPPSEPEPPADEATATECRECGVALVVPPDEVCDACARPAPPPEPDEPADPTGPPDTEHDEREEPPMTAAASATHEINPDVRDPTTALAFADACGGFSKGATGQLDILAANLQRMEVGSGPIGEVRVLADAARNHSGSCERSVTKYAEHVVSQQDIATDDDVKNTVRRTYLDAHGTAGGPAGRSGGRDKISISATDCTDPTAAADFMDKLAAMYGRLKGNAVDVKGAHERQGVSGEPLRFLAEQVDLATVIADKSQTAARTFRRHVQRRNDTVGKDPSLHGTQNGKYLDPAKA